MEATCYPGIDPSEHPDLIEALNLIFEDITLDPDPIMATATTPVRKLWAKKGIDLSDATYIKAWQSEVKFDSSSSSHFNLEPELFPIWIQSLKDKSDRCCFSAIRTVTLTGAGTDGTDVTRDVLTQFSLLSREEMQTHSDTLFTEIPTPADGAAEDAATAERRIVQSDNIIKIDMLGEYIHASLTTSARAKFLNDRSKFKRTFEGETYYDGIFYCWLIANLVNPDNEHVVDSLKTKIRDLHIKDFGWSVISLLTEFARLNDEITQLGGAYGQSDALYDFWHAVGTMPEEEFSGFVRRTRDTYREQRPSERDSLNKLIGKMKSKQVAMESDGTWNKLSATQAQILALAASSSSTATTQPRPTNNPKRSKPLTEAFRQALQKAPTDGVTTKTFSDGKERHWCSKCSGGQGHWSFHKESDHNERHDKAYESYKERQAKAAGNNTTTTNNNSSKGDKTKKGAKANNSNTPTLTIDKKYLEALKGGTSSTATAFFSQFVPNQVKE